MWAGERNWKSQDRREKERNDQDRDRFESLVEKILFSFYPLHSF